MTTYQPILIVKRRDINGQIECDLIAMPPERTRKPFAFNAQPTGIGNAHPDDFENWQSDDDLRHWGSAYDDNDLETPDEIWDAKSGQWIPKYILSI